MLRKMYLTQVEGSYPADAYFPALSPEEWECVEESFHPGPGGYTILYRYGVPARRRCFMRFVIPSLSGLWGLTADELRYIGFDNVDHREWPCVF